MNRNERFVRLLLGGAAIVLLVFSLGLCTAGASCWFGGGAFVKFGIGTDLDDYRQWTRESDLAPEAQDEVLQRVDRIDRMLDEGTLVIPFALWVNHDAAIEGILADRVVPPDELAELHDELSRIEKRRN